MGQGLDWEAACAQRSINKVFRKHKVKEVTCGWRLRSIREGFVEEGKEGGVAARTLQAEGMDE